MITEKIDQYLNEDYTDKWPRMLKLQQGELKAEKAGSKVDLKMIGYKETSAKCCGTCNFFMGDLCKCIKNLRIVFDKTKMPPGAGLWVSPSGICPNYDSID